MPDGRTQIIDLDNHLVACSSVCDPVSFSFLALSLFLSLSVRSPVVSGPSFAANYPLPSAFLALFLALYSLRVSLQA